MPKAEVIIQPVCLRFSIFEGEVSYHFAAHPDAQLDDMERWLGIDPEGKSIANCNLGFLPVASTTLIRSENKNILVDPGNHHLGFYGLLGSALQQRGLSIEDIDTVVVTHWHHDHFSNLHLFHNAELVIGKGELEFGAQIYGKSEVDAKVSHVKRITEVDESGSILLDEGVEVIFTPGHSPGSISAVVRGDETNDVTAIIGDAAMTKSEYMLRKWSHWYDTDQKVELNQSLDRISAYRPTKVICGHDRMFELQI